MASTVDWSNAATAAHSKDLLTRLLESDTEDQAIEVLEEAGLWTNAAAWRLYGDAEDNFSPAGSQQRNPEAALVEKLVNSVDACLMGKALEAGIDPRGPKAPASPGGMPSLPGRRCSRTSTPSERRSTPQSWSCHQNRRPRSAARLCRCQT
jgi:hypothetical protein